MKANKKILLLLTVSFIIAIIFFIIARYYYYEKLYYIAEEDSVLVASTSELVETSESEKNIISTEDDNLDDGMEEFKEEVYITEEIFKIVLLGLDTNYDTYSGRSDAIMVISVNNISKEIRVSSFMRDLLVSIKGHGNTKLGHAYAYGRGSLVLDTLNKNFNLSLENYAAVNFISLAEIIDILGGVNIDLKDNEVSEISGINNSGLQTLNGKQAVQYSRIRRVGNGDFERTNRQRRVFAKLIEKLGSYESEELVQVTLEILPYLSTNLSEREVVDFIIGGSDNLRNYTISEKRIPEPETFYSDLISGIYYLILKDNANIIDDISDYLNFIN